MQYSVCTDCSTDFVSTVINFITVIKTMREGKELITVIINSYTVLTKSVEQSVQTEYCTLYTNFQYKFNH